VSRTAAVPDKRPLDQLLDVCVFAPFGLAANARELVPKLAEQGREQLDLQVRIARMLGQFVVAKGRLEAGKAFGRLQDSAWSATRPGPAPGARAPAAPAPSLADEEVIPVRRPDVDAVTAASVGVDELAIPEYDALAASQVVQRLEGLTEYELEAVRRYEVAHRGRKTILGKITQLQAR